jgi:hypothetical protein
VGEDPIYWLGFQKDCIMTSSLEGIYPLYEQRQQTTRFTNDVSRPHPHLAPTKRQRRQIMMSASSGFQAFYRQIPNCSIANELGHNSFLYVQIKSPNHQGPSRTLDTNISIHTFP